MPLQIAPIFMRNPPGAGDGQVRYGGSLKEVSPVLWRKRLREASFKQAAFHVETQGRVAGRRTVLHQYPKLDIPWAEDLGREAIRYQITGYVLQRWQPKQGNTNYGNMPWNYDMARDRLIAALEDEGPGRLIDPYNNRIGPQLFQCERYAVTESRERGGYAQFEMSFVESGQSQAFTFLDVDTKSEVAGTANTSTSVVAQLLNREMSIINRQRPTPTLPPGFTTGNVAAR